MIFFITQWLVSVMYGIEYSRDTLDALAWMSGVELFVEGVALTASVTVTIASFVTNRIFKR